MSSEHINRRWIVLGLLATGGCGFAPVHGQKTSLRGRIAFDTPGSVAGFRLRERLEERLGPVDAARYMLRVRLSDSRRRVAINDGGDTTRFNLIGSASWRLADVDTNDTVGDGRVETFTSYAATGSTVATQSAEADASARLSVALADMIVSRILILSQKRPS